MKYIFLVVCLIGSQLLSAQQKPTDLDKSPVDMSYWPANYPILKMRGQVTEDPVARIIYSRPQKKGRTIFGGEVKYNEVWRLGANESTEIEFYRAVKLGGKKIAKGKYTLFCIPLENKWTLILNKELNTWGSFTYNADKDVLRVDAPVQKTDSVEALTLYFEGIPGGSNLVILWDEAKFSVPIIL